MWKERNIKPKTNLHTKKKGNKRLTISKHARCYVEWKKETRENVFL